MKIITLGLVWLGLCGASLLQALPAQVIIIRHAEKPAEGNALSLKGQERAAALVPFFQGYPEVLRFGTPVAIYAMNAPTATASVRPIETVQGLAKALGLTVNTRYRHEEYASLAADIKNNAAYEGKMVLIAWEHQVIPLMVEAFGVHNAPKTWPGDVFDRLWIINYISVQKPEFRNLPQRLMFGDSPQ